MILFKILKMKQLFKIKNFLKMKLYRKNFQKKFKINYLKKPNNLNK